MSPVRIVLGMKHGPRGWWDIRPTASQIAISIWMFVVSGVCLVAFAFGANATTKVQDLNRANHVLILKTRAQATHARELAIVTHGLAARAHRLGLEIQAQRRRAIIEGCENSNEKYKHFKRELHRLAPRSPARKTKAVLRLISTIVPHRRNCRAVVHAKVKIPRAR